MIYMIIWEINSISIVPLIFHHLIQSKSSSSDEWTLSEIFRHVKYTMKKN